MTLAKRIIPTILVRGKTAYKGDRFVSTRSIGSAAAIARVHAKRGVDELCILDIAATAEGRGPDLDLVRELSDGCFIPITVGGGVKTLHDIDALLRAGADKVCIGAATQDRELLRAASARFGSQAIVASLDVPYGCIWWPYKYRAILLEKDGCGEILLQAMDHDGTMCGYALDLIRDVSAGVSIPVIASGGCSGYDDMAAAFAAGADACAAGALFQFTDATPKGAARFLKARGLEVRV
jgi:cyclase